MSGRDTSHRQPSCERHITQCLLDKGKPVVRRGRKAMGLNRSEGGTDKAARLPKGWTGPVSKSGTQAAKAAWVIFCARTNRPPHAAPCFDPASTGFVSSRLFVSSHLVSSRLFVSSRLI